MTEENLPKILVACPTSQVKDYAFLNWLMHVRNIDYPKDKIDIMMCDNSKENGYDKYLNSWGIKTRRIHPRNRNSIEYLCDSHNAIREYFLEKGHDYWLHLESDVMIQTQTLRTLLFHSEQGSLSVVSASYFHDQKNGIIIHRQKEYGERRQSQALGFKEAISLSNKFIKVFGCGLGATLIRRDIFEHHNIKFRFNPTQQVYPDSFFYEDLFLKNIPAYMDTSLILDHDSRDWGKNIDHAFIPKYN